MHSSPRSYEPPRAHRPDLINRCALSDCCGAPIIPGGICSDCRELCEEDDGDSRHPALYGRPPFTREANLDHARIERPNFSCGDEDSSSAFDEMVLKIIST